jgi:hypothetical protein
MNIPPLELASTPLKPSRPATSARVSLPICAGHLRVRGMAIARQNAEPALYWPSNGVHFAPGSPVAVAAHSLQEGKNNGL